MSVGFDFHRDHGGDPRGEEARRYKAGLAKSGGGAETLYEESDRYLRRSIEQFPGDDPGPDLKPDPRLEPYQGPIIEEDADTASKQPTSVEQTAQDIKPENLIQENHHVTAASPLMGKREMGLPAPKKPGFFGRIGAGLNRVWSRVRSLFGRGGGTASRTTDHTAIPPTDRTVSQSAGERKYPKWFYDRPPVIAPGRVRFHEDVPFSPEFRDKQTRKDLWKELEGSRWTGTSNATPRGATPEFWANNNQFNYGDEIDGYEALAPIDWEKKPPVFDALAHQAPLDEAGNLVSAKRQQHVSGESDEEDDDAGVFNSGFGDLLKRLVPPN